MKRTKICGVNIDETKSFWTNGVVGGLLKQNKRILFSRIDFLQELSSLTNDDKQLREYYNNIDFYFVLICLIDKFGSDDLLLDLSLSIACQSYENGSFVCDSIDENERNCYYQTLLNRLIEETNNNNLIEETEISEDLKTLVIELVENNVYINPLTDEVSKYPFAESGVYGDLDYSAELKKQGVYFTYAQADARYFLSDKTARIKRIGQTNLKEQLKVINPTFRGEVAENLINSGIIAKCGATPDTIVEMMKNGESARVNGLILGMTVATFIGYCVAVLSAVAMVWSAYIAYKSEKVKRETAELLQQNNLRANCPSENDFRLGDTNGDGVLDSDEKKNLLKKICIIGGGLLLLYQIL